MNEVCSCSSIVCYLCDITKMYVNILTAVLDFIPFETFLYFVCAVHVDICFNCL